MRNYELEDWEKDFTGLTKWLTISIDQLNKYKIAAIQSKTRLETKYLNNQTVELWVAPDCDMETFWNVFE